MSFPKFFNYKDDKVDQGYEALHDFFLSWTLRCAAESNTENPKVQKAAKCYLLYLCEINKFKFDKVLVEKVVTKRQVGHVDLLAEVTLIVEETKKLIILNIENKWYSDLRPDQLEKSQEVAKKEYPTLQDNIRSWLLLPDHIKISDKVKLLCKKNGYNLQEIDGIKEKSGMTQFLPTGNYMFDEFWVNFYTFNKGGNKDTFQCYQEVIINWGPPKIWSDVEILNTDSERSIYQINCDSHIYGKDVLAYIGKTDRLFDERKKEHEKTFWQNAKNITYRIGKVVDFSDDLEIIESILIANHKPFFNKQFIHDLAVKAKSHKIIVFNHGDYSSLKSVCTNYWWVNSGTKNSI